MPATAVAVTGCAPAETADEAAACAPYLFEQIKIIGPEAILALGDHFHAEDLVQAVSVGPAMLHYLDNNLNVAGAPNENFARELMELFTLGVGNYTEDDVRASARAWSAITVMNAPRRSSTASTTAEVFS